MSKICWGTLFAKRDAVEGGSQQGGKAVGKSDPKVQEKLEI
jgi:hypothetical protein